MTIEVRKNVIGAKQLALEAHKAGLMNSCLPIAAKALGAEISLLDLLNLEEGRDTPHHLAFGTGLVCYQVAAFNQENKINNLEEQLQLRLNGTSRVVGCLLGVSNAEIKDGHVIAIPNINTLPRDARIKLKKSRKILIIDPNSGSLARGISVTDLEKSVNSSLLNGTIAFLYSMGIKNKR
jgi:hypothetical protein